MSISVSVTQETGYRYVKVKGTYSLSDAYALFDRIYAESLETNCKNTLLDISEVAGKVPGMDRFNLAAYASRLWKYPIRVAIVYRAEEIDKFFENAGSNRGVSTIVVPDVQTALKWLIGNTPSKSDAGDRK
jgi:hypothetical protein